MINPTIPVSRFDYILSFINFPTFGAELSKILSLKLWEHLKSGRPLPAKFNMKTAQEPHIDTPRDTPRGTYLDEVSSGESEGEIKRGDAEDEGVVAPLQAVCELEVEWVCDDVVTIYLTRPVVVLHVS